MIEHPNEGQSRGRGGMRVLVALLVGTMLLWPACKGDQSKSQATAVQTAPAPVAVNAASYDPPANEPPAPKVDGKKAFQYVDEIVAFGPRPIGSEAHRKVEDYIKSHLQGVEVEEDKFTANTAAGSFPMNNIIAKIPGTKDGIIVLASHYDTNYPLRNENFVGANDGASTSGLLLELANVLKSKPNDGYSVWLVFDDGEEATVNWSDSDSLYGIKRLANRWKNDGTAQKIKAFILLDMIGDKDLNVARDTNSTPWLQDLVGRAARRLGYGSYFYKSDQAMDDDHIPMKNIGVPVVDLIDFDYGWNNLYWHTTEDTMDKISPKSLQIVGDTVMESIRALNTK